MPAALPKPYRVLLVGDLPEVDASAQFKLRRLIEWAGLDFSRFEIISSQEGVSYEYFIPTDIIGRSRVLVPMGNRALRALVGREGILSIRGYVLPGPEGTHILPTVHPSFIQRGQSKYSAAFIHDLQKAVELAESGLTVEPVEYRIDPSPREAYEWAQEYRRRLDSGVLRLPALHGEERLRGNLLHDRPSLPLRLAYDIETPGKGDDEGDLQVEDVLGGSEDRTYHIWRIGFAYEPGRALTVPWTPPYLAAIRLLLESEGEKVVWNAGFDNPRIRAQGVQINGVIHDGMVAWHILHSDLPKGLGFVATFTCPHQPPWKHLSTKAPGFYNCTDADVELRSMIAIEEELRRTGLWEVYQRDVLDLEPILQHMHREGMPIDKEVRADRAVRLAHKQADVLARLEALTPVSARTYTPKEGYVRAPADTAGLIRISVAVPVTRCDRCGERNPLKPHFRAFKRPTTAKPQNPCAGAGKVVNVEVEERYARLDDFTPSRNQIIRYNQALNRPTPKKKDKKSGQFKLTTDEKAMKELIRKHPDDPFYPGVLEYRELDKLAGTYIGRPAGLPAAA